MLNLTEPTLFRPDDILAQREGPPWSKVLFRDGRNEIALMCDTPGIRVNDASVHPDHNEFWVVLRGEYEWLIGDFSPIRAIEGDVVVCPAGIAHTVTAIGDEVGLRVAVYMPDGITEKGRHPIGANEASHETPPNHVFTRIGDLLANSDERRFTIIEDNRNTMFLIREYPGTVSNAHWHFDFDEWWTIIGGELVFEAGDGRPKLHTRTGDLVFMPRGFRHQITTVGEFPSLRMPVTTADNVHIWTDDDTAAPPPRV